MTVVRVRRSADGVVLLAGLAVLGVGMLLVRASKVSGFEASVFRAVNDLPQAMYPMLYPFQQLGALPVAPLLALVMMFYRRWYLALLLLIATAAKLVSERVVKMIVSRQRPGTSIGPSVHRRGTVSIHGESFVSGHAILVGAMATLVTPYLHGRWRILPWALLGMVMVTRVYVGAHNPLDVICGAALGIAIGALLNLAFGVPKPQEPSTAGAGAGTDAGAPAATSA